MSVKFDKLYKNEQLKEYFSSVIESGNMPHAIILEGAKGSGRTTFAMEIVKAMSCCSDAKPCGICDRCRKIENSVYADVMITSLPEGKSIIPVDAVREIKANALSVPVEGDYKFFIIKDSEKMNVQAQNALLKILEEPRPFVVFILICTSASLLLPTVVSRAPVFRMQRLLCEELEEYFKICKPELVSSFSGDHDGFARILKNANGAIGAVLENTDKRSLNGSLKRYERMDSFFSALVGTDKSSFIAYEADINAKKRDDFAAYVGELRLAFRDLLAVKRGYDNELLFFTNEERARELSLNLTLEGIVSMIGLCDEALVSNDLNANINLLKINLMSGIWKHSCS